MASRVALALAGGLLALLAVLLAAQNDASADQRLQNGGFESGLTSWAGGGLSASGCTPRSGSGALNLSSGGSGQLVVAQQAIPGPFANGIYTLSGFYRVGSGAPTITATYIWRTPAGDQLPRNQNLSAVPNYTGFSFSDNNPPANATNLVVKLAVVSTAAAMVCFDDLGLEAPAPPPPTPMPTATATATLMPTATATFVPTATTVPPTPTSTIPQANPIPPTPTSTATTVNPPTATRTAVSDPSQPSTPTSTTGTTVATPTPTSTTTTSAAAAPAGFQFTNGGFEQGTAGWQRYGGDLQGTSSPTHSGSGAGILASGTTSTKWAYQVVTVDPEKAYEFNGYLRPAGGVKSAYLRISWYESADGGGSAISTDDSGSKLSGSNDAYTYVGTGGIAPPAAAHSARLRVMLAPEGTSAASVYLDDFSFTTTTAAPRPASKSSSPDEPFETPAPAATPRPADATSTAAQATSVQVGGTPAVAATAHTPETPKEATAIAKAAKTSTASAARASASGSKATLTPKQVLTAEVAGTRSDKPPEGQGGADDPASLMLSPNPDPHSKTATVALGLLAMMAAGGGAHYLSKRPGG